MSDTQQKGIGAIAVVLIIAAVVIVSGIGFYAFKGNTPQTTEPVETTQTLSPTSVEETANPEATNSTEMDSATATVVKMTGKNFRFTPDTITVKKGQKVKVEFTSGDMMHDFVIDELNVKSSLAKAGQTVTVEFTPTKTGTYEFYCFVGNHRAMGMVGSLVVQ